MPFEARAHDVQIDRFVARLQKDRLSPIAPLGHLMRRAWNDHSCKPGHDPFPRYACCSEARSDELIMQLISCHRNPIRRGRQQRQGGLRT